MVAVEGWASRTLGWQGGGRPGNQPAASQELIPPSGCVFAAAEAASSNPLPFQTPQVSARADG